MASVSDGRVTLYQVHQEYSSFSTIMVEVHGSDSLSKNQNHELLPFLCWNWNIPDKLGIRPVTQIPQCTSPISHNAPFCNRNVHTCAHFCHKMVHYGIFVWCIVGFVRWVYWLDSINGSFFQSSMMDFNHLDHFSLINIESRDICLCLLNKIHFYKG